NSRSIEGVRITGASASYFRVRPTALSQGRVFQEQEDELGLPVVVIGSEVAERLFENTPPLGKTIRIQGFPYQVIGVMERQGSLFGMSLDNQVIAPARSRLNGFVNRKDVVGEMIYQVPDARYLPGAVVEVEGLMRVRRQLLPSEPNN